MILVTSSSPSTMSPDERGGMTGRRQTDSGLFDWDGVKRAIGSGTRFIVVHASMLMAAAVICLFAMVIVWMLFQPSPLL